MKHLRHINEEYRVGDQKIEPELLKLVQTNEQYNDIVEEFDLNTIEINNDYIQLKNKDGLELIIDVAMNKIIVKLDRKELHSSSHFLVDKRTNTLTKDGRLESKLTHIFYFAALGLMEAVWRINYKNADDIILKLSDDDIQKIIKDTKLTLHDIKTGMFGNGIQKYHLLNNLIKLNLKYVLQLEHLPNSIDVDPETRKHLKELEKISPGFL